MFCQISKHNFPSVNLTTPYYTGRIPLLFSNPLPPDMVSPPHINFQTATALQLECQWEFREKCSMSGLWASFRDQISLLTSKVIAPAKAYKCPLHKPYYTRRVKRAIQCNRKDWESWKNLGAVNATPFTTVCNKSSVSLGEFYELNGFPASGNLQSQLRPLQKIVSVM